MQHDDHVWAWRTYRKYLFGLVVGMKEIGIVHAPLTLPRIRLDGGGSVG